MSRSLPPEIRDLIVDLLRDDPAALKACCVVSKSWVPRTQKHLFAHVGFFLQSHVELWKKTFPDPSKSPARYTRSLSVRGSSIATAGAGDCIHTFRNVVHLHVDARRCGDDQASLTPLCGLSSTLKSLRLVYGASASPSEVFGLVCSFPLLEDLALVFLGHDDEVCGWTIPLTSPKLTGSLDLRMLGGIRSATHRLLGLPNGLHFSKIAVSCLDEDVGSTMSLVSRCSDTLESLNLYYFSVTSQAPSLDLSKVTKLKDVAFGCSRPNVQWITIALRTAESTNLQQITIHLDAPFGHSIGETIQREWKDLDRLLFQFWTSRSIRLKVTYKRGMGRSDLRDPVPNFLPELTRRGVVELVEN